MILQEQLTFAILAMSSKLPKDAKLDPGLVPAPKTWGFISFERLTKGEYVVGISY